MEQEHTGVLRAPADSSDAPVATRQPEDEEATVSIGRAISWFVTLVLGCLVAYAIGIEGMKHPEVARLLPEAEDQMELALHRLTVGLGGIFALMTVVMVLGGLWRLARGRPMMSARGPKE